MDLKLIKYNVRNKDLLNGIFALTLFKYDIEILEFD